MSSRTPPNLPQYLLDVLADAPVNVDKRKAAELVTKYLFPVAARSLEVWPIRTWHVNNKAVHATADVFVHAWEKMRAAPVMMGGRRQVPLDQHENEGLEAGS
jgi:hypothetical protein